MASERMRRMSSSSVTRSPLASKKSNPPSAFDALRV